MVVIAVKTPTMIAAVAVVRRKHHSPKENTNPQQVSAKQQSGAVRQPRQMPTAKLVMDVADLPVAAPIDAALCSKPAAAEHKLPADLNELHENPDDISPTHIPMLIQRYSGNVLLHSLDAQGCRVMQRLLSVASDTERKTIAGELCGHVHEAVESPHANHVLQKCIEMMRPATVQFIFKELLQCDRPTNIARHRYGCRVLERFIEHFPPLLLGGFVEEILGETVDLCKHRYGNFVLQHLLEHGDPAQRQRITDVLHEDLRAMALHQHACRVLDKALTYAPVEEQRALATQVLKDTGLLGLMEDVRGGCVTVQRLLVVVSGNETMLQDARCQLAVRPSMIPCAVPVVSSCRTRTRPPARVGHRNSADATQGGANKKDSGDADKKASKKEGRVERLALRNARNA